MDMEKLAAALAVYNPTAHHPEDAAEEFTNLWIDFEQKYGEHPEDVFQEAARADLAAQRQSHAVTGDGAALAKLRFLVKMLRFSPDPILTDERYTLADNIDELLPALGQSVPQEVVEKEKAAVDTPSWKDAEPKEKVINELRQDLAAPYVKGGGL